MLSTLASETTDDRNSEAVTDENATNQPVDKQEDEKEEAEAPTEETTTEEATEEDVEQPKPLKIGEREFATTEDALKEATRIIGRNAQLAGDTKRFKSEAQEFKAKYEEALRVNSEWANLFEKSKKRQGQEDTEDFEETPKAKFDPEEVATKAARAAAAEIRAEQAREIQTQKMMQELNEVVALPNYDEVSETIELLSDKINPLSGKYYTPKEAYEFACKYNDVDNLLNPKTVQKIAQPIPKKIVKPLVPSASARPAAVRTPVLQKENSRDTFADNILSEAFPY
jgi:hypothetical protein